jgi:hypothetical protein
LATHNPCTTASKIEGGIVAAKTSF